MTIPTVKILGIAGSPRSGNTEILVKTALEEARKHGAETEFVSLHGKKIGPCLDCEGCRKNEPAYLCVIKDDMQEIYPKIVEADGIILGSPVYMYTISAQLKALMDRTTCLMFRYDYIDFSKKVGAAIAVGYGRHGGVEFALQTIINYFLNCKTIVVSNCTDDGLGGPAWQMGDAEESARDSVLEDKLGLKLAREVGERIAKTAQIVKAGLETTGIK